MGHAVDYITVDRRSDIMKAAQEYAYCNVDREENPSGSYHGNMHIHDTPICDNYDDALSRLNEWDTGWYSDHAVQYRDKTVLKPTKQMEAVKERRNKLIYARDEYKREHSLKNRKSAYIGCKECGSKISLAHLNGYRCPVCGKELRAEYIVNRIKKFNEDINALQAQYSELQKKQEGNCPVKWLVKVEVHC